MSKMKKEGNFEFNVRPTPSLQHVGGYPLQPVSRVKDDRSQGDTQFGGRVGTSNQPTYSLPPLTCHDAYHGVIMGSSRFLNALGSCYF
jgi:hypothetical protein